MFILGIETSCDETSAAAVENGTVVRSNVIATSSDSFSRLGGVIPECAARKQIECILPVIEQALKDANITPNNIDAIAVTKGPGLLGSLLVGTTTARVLASIWKKPLIGVHHTMGHLSSTWLYPLPRRTSPDGGGLRRRVSLPLSRGRVGERVNKKTTLSLTLSLQRERETSDPLPLILAPIREGYPSPPGGGKIRFPLLALSVSGGHTELWYRESHTKGKLLGATRDDAAGEAFDKGASLLGLPYPGGPSIAKAAEGGNPHAFEFPLPLKNEPTLDFSLSGLKTALKYLLIPSPLGGGLGRGGKIGLRNKEFSTPSPPSAMSSGPNGWPSPRGRGNTAFPISDIAASYQHAICRHLTDRIQKAIEQYPDINEIHIVGGVSANTHLRTLLAQTIPVVPLRFPLSLAYCTDNAAMIAAAGYFMHAELKKNAFAPFETSAYPVA